MLSMKDCDENIEKFT